MTDELKEKITWQNINSSKVRGKILSGKITAIEVEKLKGEDITCAIVDFRGIKILIPATEMTKDGKNEKRLIRNMMGADIKFIISEIDKVGEKAIGSRIKAMERIKEINWKRLEVGDNVYGKVVGIWKKNIRIEVLGMDFVMQADELQYGFVEDLSKIYKMNEQIKVVIKDMLEENKTIKISVKDLIEDPFKNIRKDFTEKGEYLAKVTGYTDNGIYANIAQGIDTICILPAWLSRPPFPGENIIVKIYKISAEKRKVYSSIVKIIGSDASE